MDWLTIAIALMHWVKAAGHPLRRGATHWYTGREQDTVPADEPAE